MKLKEELRTRAEVKKRGHSLGIIIPTTVARKLTLKEHEKVEVKLKKVGGVEELFGKLHFGKPTKEVIKEIKEGWKVQCQNSSVCW